MELVCSIVVVGVAILLMLFVESELVPLLMRKIVARNVLKINIITGSNYRFSSHVRWFDEQFRSTADIQEW